MEAREDPAASSEILTVDHQPFRRHVDRVALVPAPVEMRVLCQFRSAGAYRCAVRSQRKDLTDLEPAEQHMQVWGAATVSPDPAPEILHLAEPAEEQEQVADADTLVGQMLLRGADLTESRPPAWKPGPGGRRQVGIVMGVREPEDRPLRQAGRDLAEVEESAISVR